MLVGVKGEVKVGRITLTLTERCEAAKLQEVNGVNEVKEVNEVIEGS